jgi:hypothetical protein
MSALIDSSTQSSGLAISWFIIAENLLRVQLELH